MEQKGFLARLFDTSFSEFITPHIIKVLFILSIVEAGIGAFLVLIGGLASRSGVVVLFTLILAPVIFVVWVLTARVVLELILVVFRIEENTRQLVEQGKAGKTLHQD